MTAALLEEVQKLSDDEQQELVLGLVEKMSVLNLSTLVKRIETKFDVIAAPSGGSGGNMPQRSNDTAPPPVEEKTEFAVFLKEAGQKKIQVIKEVRAITGLGLKEAKDLVDTSPKVVKSKMTKQDAENAKKLLEDAGATVELQ